MTTRTESLDQIKSLITEHQISKSELLSLLADAHPDDKNSGGLLQRAMIYIGGAFIFMGLCVYIGMIWDDLNPLSRVIISLGSGFVAFILGLFCIGDARYTKAATPLFLIAAALEPLGLFVFMDEYLPHTGDILKAACVVFGFMTIQQSVAFVATNRTSLLFFSLYFFYAFLYVFMGWMDIYETGTIFTLSLTGLMVAWGLSRTEHKSIAGYFYFCASIAVAATAFDLLKNSSYDVALIGVSAGLIYLSVIGSSRTTLIIGVLSLLAFLGYFTNEYFSDMVGWPIAMIIMGFVMMGISTLAIKLGKKIKKQES